MQRDIDPKKIAEKLDGSQRLTVSLLQLIEKTLHNDRVNFTGEELAQINKLIKSHDPCIDFFKRGLTNNSFLEKLKKHVRNNDRLAVIDLVHEATPERKKLLKS